jgi:type III secretory pathway lipoprotein EscJ
MVSLRVLMVGVAVMLYASGCGSTPVADDIGQKEANQLVSLLRDHGITAQVTKARGSKGRYSVSVSDDRYVDAAGILTRVGLPADKKASFEDLTAAHGIIPVSREVEALRLDRATASEIEGLLQARADIAAASVLVRARASEGKGPVSATVVIQKKPGVQIRPDDIREIATRAVPGIKAEDVFLSISDSPTLNDKEEKRGEKSPGELVSFLGISRVPASDYQTLVFLFIALTVFVAVLAGLGGYLLGQFTAINRQGGGDTSRGLSSAVRRAPVAGRSNAIEDDSSEEVG